MPDRKKDADAALRRLGAAVVSLRAASERTQEDIAEAAGLTSRYVQMLERGDANPSYLKLRALASAFGIPVEELIARAESASAATLARLRPRERR